MLMLILLVTALLLISIGETVKDLRRAPVGYEDESGFHVGFDPESEF